MQEMTAVMLESARKGLWKASSEQVAALAELHTEMVDEFGAACSGFVCDNAKLREFIASKVSPSVAGKYNSAVAEVRAETVSADNDGMVMKHEELNDSQRITNRINGIIVACVVVAALAGLVILIRRRRKNGR